VLNKNDIEKLAQMRVEDAVQLLQANRASASYYLAGYAVELSLKACISKLFRDDCIPDKALVNTIYTHKLDTLMSVSGLLPEFKSDMKEDAVLGSYWGITTKWTPESRYEFWDPIAASTLVNAIIDNDHGVFPWVKKHW